MSVVLSIWLSAFAAGEVGCGGALDAEVGGIDVFFGNVGNLLRPSFWFGVLGLFFLFCFASWFGVL